LEEYGRGIAGGLLFSVPLLYTMEVWWRGFIADPAHLLIYLALTFVLLLGYNRYGGMHPDAHWYEVAVDSIEEMGLGLLISAGILYLLGRITPETPPPEILGKIVIEAMTVAIGVSVGTAQLGGGNGGPNGEEKLEVEPNTQAAEPPKVDHWAQTVLGFCGAILVASNVAPTEEIVIIGIETSPARLLGLAILSLAIAGMVLFYSGFVGSDRHVHRDGGHQIAVGVVHSYGVALAASALMLWFFGRFSGVSFPVAVAQTVVLAFPAVLGASAGRLLIQ
jgi:putative integral membrane protein (TIGR02587 family)